LGSFSDFIIIIMITTACPRKKPPNYNGVVLKILGKHQWNFYNWIQHICILCAKICENLM